MSGYRNEWSCCGDETYTQAWEPEECPFCEVNRLQSEVERLRGRCEDAEARCGDLAEALHYLREPLNLRTIRYPDFRRRVEFADSVLSGEKFGNLILRSQVKALENRWMNLPHESEERRLLEKRIERLKKVEDDTQPGRDSV